jgi:hypothetical protein
MYTYGAPRVGNKAFADAFDARLGGAAWRITNSSDIVPTVPRLMGYAHVQTGVRLGSGGALEFESSSKDLLGEGREVAEAIAVRPHTPAAAWARAKGLGALRCLGCMQC